ncbi:TOM1-like protein 2 [Vitis vinifera]|uniref:TOM1-like protein 2 n=1 Tax=Vitis vinifera TaxID=29760 RepID=A0A438F0T4_VITVI|nr:TOM1-like protein 2 [Vitis vinifera]
MGTTFERRWKEKKFSGWLKGKLLDDIIDKLFMKFEHIYDEPPFVIDDISDKHPVSVKRSGTPPPVQDGSSPPIPYSLESYVHQQPLSPPGSYPIPDAGLHRADSTAFSYNYGILSMKEKKEFLLITRNSLELLSSILDSQTEPKPIKDDLTVSMVEKCKQSQPVVQRIVESTINDEGMLFEALYLHDELQQVISKYEEMEAKSTAQLPENPNTAGAIQLSQSSLMKQKQQNLPREKAVKPAMIRKAFDAGKWAQYRMYVSWNI